MSWGGETLLLLLWTLIILFCSFTVYIIHHQVVYISFSLIGDSLGVAQLVFAIMWFKPTELSRVFGLLLSFSRMV